MQKLPSVIVFGRPGAGKTTVANAAVEKLQTSNDNITCLGLDLDVCVPQWMRDNFANGIYPTLEERNRFANECCQYVTHELAQAYRKNKALASVVSFSFVNTDLRDIYRQNFPDALWVLIDTTEQEATKRINAREDHFYKGDTSSDEINADADHSTVDTPESDIDDDDENNQWNFAPVTFSHIRLDGNQPVEENADQVIDLLLKKGEY